MAAVGNPAEGGESPPPLLSFLLNLEQYHYILPSSIFLPIHMQWSRKAAWAAAVLPATGRRLSGGNTKQRDLNRSMLGQLCSGGGRIDGSSCISAATSGRSLRLRSGRTTVPASGAASGAARPHADFLMFNLIRTILVLA